MTWVGWMLVALAAGFVALALYGKYRMLKDEHRHALEEERRALNREEPPAPA